MVKALKLINPFQLKKWDTTRLNKLTTIELLESLNYLKKQQSGFYQFLPFYLRINYKIQKTINSFLQDEEIGAINLQLNLLSSKKLWEISGRWPKGTRNEMFKLVDNNKQEKCLVPTCEEDITSLMKNYINSYKDLPFMVYQINNKFRDELRPRNGILRSKEFLMMDGYSFTRNLNENLLLFNKINNVYTKIFNYLQIPFVNVWASNGSMGGEISQEFHLVNSLGEDILFNCSNISCNNFTTLDLTESIPPMPQIQNIKKNGEAEILKKTNVRYLLTKNNANLICLYYPNGKILNWVLIKKHLQKIDPNLKLELDSNLNFKIYTVEQIINKLNVENYSIFSYSKIIKLIDIRCDDTLSDSSIILKKVLSNKSLIQLKKVSIVNASEGDICNKCQKGQLKPMNSIEIGHTFVLGDKYSKPFKLVYVNEQNNKDNLVQMGCYGIGISRIIGAMADLKRDSMGLNWPLPMAPYLMSICYTNKNKSIDQESKNNKVDIVKNELHSLHFLQDEIFHNSNSNLNIGSKIQSSHALGIPIVLVVNDKTWPQIEIEIRNSNFDKDALFSNLKNISLENVNFKYEVISNMGKITKFIIPKTYLNQFIETVYQNMSNCARFSNII